MSDHDKLREAIRWARNTSDSPTAVSAHLTALANAAESTLPRTKMVEVWHVEFCDEDGAPYVTVCGDKVIAEARALSIRGGVATCIRVTGPHMQEIPA